MSACGVCRTDLHVVEGETSCRSSGCPTRTLLMWMPPHTATPPCARRRAPLERGWRSRRQQFSAHGVLSSPKYGGSTKTVKPWLSGAGRSGSWGNMALFYSRLAKPKIVFPAFPLASTHDALLLERAEFGGDDGALALA